MTRGFQVIDPGLLTTVQDGGRAGFAHLGVPSSGALDRGAWALANRLVGNSGACAVLETTLTGCALRALGSQAVAVTGAFADITVDARPMAWGSRIVVPDGSVLRVGPARYGARSLIAVAGGIDLEPVLGSRSRDMLSGLGPDPLAGGTVIATGAPAGGAGEPVEAGFRVPTRRWRMLPGPHHSWCDPSDLATTWRVSAESNRIGLRLDGAAIPRKTGEIRSLAMITGAVQLPPSGQPIILLADHATTGGYPVVAVVVPEDLDACAQASPGEEITLAWR